MKGFLVGIAVLLLAACASTRRYEAILDNWVGKDAKSLTRKWGEPNRVHAFSDGRKAYEYRFSDRHNPELKDKRTPAGTNVGCRTFFITDPDDVILSWKWEGHDCVAK